MTLKKLMVACLVNCFLLYSQTTINGGRVFKGTLDASGAASTLPHRTGLGSPSGRDSCAKAGETYLQIDGAAGTNIWVCTALGTPGTWVSGGGGGGLPEPGVNGIVSRTGSGQTAARAIMAGTGLLCVNGDGVFGNPTCSLDSTVASTHSQIQTLGPLVCNASISGGTATCTITPSPGGFVDANNRPTWLSFCPASSWGGGPLLVNWGGGAKRVFKYDGATDPAANDLRAGSCYLLGYNSSLSSGTGAYELKSLPGNAPSGSSPANVVQTNQSNTYTTGAQDFGNAGSLKIPVGAGAAPTTNGQIAYDSTNNMLHAAQGGADARIPQFTAIPVNGDCAKWTVSGSQYKLDTAGAACGSGDSGFNPQTSSYEFTDFAGDRFSFSSYVLGPIQWDASCSGSITAPSSAPAGTFGALAFTTGGGSGDVCGIWHNAGTGNYGGATFDILARLQLGSTAASAFFVGINNSNLNFNSERAGIEYDTSQGDTDFMCEAVKGGAGTTRVASGITADTNYHTFHIYSSSAGTVVWQIDGVSVCGSSTNISTVATNAGMIFVKTIGADTKSLTVDYWQQKFSIPR